LREAALSLGRLFFFHKKGCIILECDTLITRRAAIRSPQQAPLSRVAAQQLQVFYLSLLRVKRAAQKAARSPFWPENES